VFEAFTAATVIYLLTNLIVVLAMRALEKKVRVPGLSRGRRSPSRSLDAKLRRVAAQKHPAPQRKD